MQQIVLTVQQGQHFLNYLSGGLRMPDALGEDKYDVSERSWIDSKLIALKNLIMFDYSTRLKNPRGICFGGVENWEILKTTGCAHCGQMNPQWIMVDTEVEVPVRLNDDAAEGIYWAMLLMAHPKSPAAAGMNVLSDTVWPLAKAMGLDKMLTKDIGLGSKRPRKILSNDEIERESAKKASPDEKKPDSK